MIEIRHIEKWFGGRRVLNDCTTFVAAGEVAVICGPPGSGKSTLLHCVNGLEPLDRGEILVDGVSVGRPDADLPKLRARVGAVLQTVELFPHLTALRNVELAQGKVLGRDKAARRSKALHWLERLGVPHCAHRKPSRLSEDERRRVAIARALAMDPLVVLFDEPTAALDVPMTAQVLDVLTSLAEGGMTMMVVTRDLRFAKRIAKRVIFMDGGEIVEDATRDEFFDRPRTERAKRFLGRALPS